MTEYGIERDVEIEAPVDVVWRTITEPDQISRWFADRVELELKPGGRGYLAFGEDKGTAIVVDTVDEPTRFSFWWNRPQDDDPTPQNSVLVEFTLTATGPQRTRLRVVETGVARLGWSDADKQGYADDHRNGWVQCFTRLAGLFGAAGHG